MDSSRTIAELDRGDAAAETEPRPVVRVAPASRPPARIVPDRLYVERVPASAMVAHHGAWQDLCERALERNVFLEPAFALPLVQHDGSAHRPDFVLVWDHGDETTFGRLIGLLPVVLAGRIVKGFESQQTRLGSPLVDRNRAAEVVDALLDGLHRLFPRATALRLTYLAAEGRVAALLAARCAASGRDVRCFGEHRRAVLQRPGAGSTNVMPFAQARRRKEIGRQRRRLSERGARVYVSARSPEEVARAAERFLALEQRGWKGERGTALLGRPSLATFTRSMARLMAFEGKCRIDAIEIDGQPVAMGIVLTVGDRAHFWKTTFHEAFAPLSPGVQFALELTERQLTDASVAVTDSCAVPDHPMIDRLWAERMEITDLLVGLKPGAPRRFRRACRREAMHRTLRAVAKSVYLRLRGGDRSKR